jgi:hypothetical protein
MARNRLNAHYVIRLERDSDGTVLHLTNGSTVRSTAMLEVVDGKLTVIEPTDDNGNIVF